RTGRRLDGLCDGRIRQTGLAQPLGTALGRPDLKLARSFLAQDLDHRFAQRAAEPRAGRRVESLALGPRPPDVVAGRTFDVAPRRWNRGGVDFILRAAARTDQPHRFNPAGRAPW